MNARLQCIACQKTFPLDEIRYTCDCGNLLSVERDAIGVGRDVFDARRAAGAMQAAFGDIASTAIVSPIARRGVRRV